MKPFVLSTALVFLMGTAYAQESAPSYVSGIRLSETENQLEEDSGRRGTIIVTGRRLSDPFPLPYETHLSNLAPSLTFDNSFGENRYEYRLPLFEVSEDSHIELYRTWNERNGDPYYGAPTRDGEGSRFVCRRPLLEVLHCLPFLD